MSVIEHLNKLPKAVLAISGTLLILGIGIVDYYTGSEFGLSIFYVLPISLITWNAGLRGGLLSALFCAIVWLSAEVLKNAAHSNIYALFWNACVRLGFFTVITLLQHALKNELVIARSDPLTEVSNRRHFIEIAEAELGRASRYNRPFTVVYLDIDDFKTVNDSMGHQAGDKLLKTVSGAIMKDIRSCDTLARLGGDEFALFLPETDKEPAKKVVEKLRGNLGEIVNRWPVTFSVGVATFVKPPDSIDDMMREVDSLMYSVKKTGKNNVSYGVFG